jgi:hypothetical protein
VVVEDLRIGRSIGAREYMFAHISGIAQLADGSVAIADSARSFAIVRRYDARGRFLNDIGRMGQGPGEYQRVTAIQVTPEGNVAIWDTRLRRVTVMTPDGDFLNSFYANSGLNSDSRVFLVGDDGSFYIQRFASPPVSLKRGSSPT